MVNKNKAIGDPIAQTANAGINQIGNISTQLSKSPFPIAVLQVALAAFICVIIIMIIGAVSKNLKITCVAIASMVIIMCIVFGFILLSWHMGMIGQQRYDFKNDVRDHNDVFNKNFHAARA
jgi:hypothetical protein